MDLGGNNNATIASTVWGNPSRTLTVGGANIVGATLQPLAINVAISDVTVANTTLVNFTGQGVLMSIGFVQVAAFSSGTCTVNLVITVDGTPYTFSVMTGAMNWVGSLKSICSQFSGNGAASGDFLNLWLPIQFNSSLVISFQVTASTLATGTTTTTVMWSHV